MAGSSACCLPALPWLHLLLSHMTDVDTLLSVSIALSQTAQTRRERAGKGRKRGRGVPKWAYRRLLSEPAYLPAFSRELSSPVLPLARARLVTTHLSSRPSIEGAEDTDMRRATGRREPRGVMSLSENRRREKPRISYREPLKETSLCME